MERIPSQPPLIPPLNVSEPRPLWSVMIPTYNCSKYLRFAIASVLQQDPGPDKMQIEVVDDFSTDADVSEIVRDIGSGRVGYYRQPENKGSLRNFETCINRAKGHYVHLMHGDDSVTDGFYVTMERLFKRFPEAGAAFCAFNMINEENVSFATSAKQSTEECVLKDFLIEIAKEPKLQYVCMVVKRSVYEKLGSFYLATYGEDWEMWTRIASNYPVAYTPEAMGNYRAHLNSITSRSFRTGENVRDIAKVIEKNIEHLPSDQRALVRKQARKYYAYDAIKKTYSLWYRSQSKESVNAQIKEVLKLYKDFGVISHCIKVKLLMLLPASWLPSIRKM
ncbi:MAG TPA: glycosyltransferase family 2 protein, partial [Chitinophagaceae bacterium]|nr:glycosyltransferase family 2 protein [Chitinophagaceae bacterium]